MRVSFSSEEVVPFSPSQSPLVCHCVLNRIEILLIKSSVFYEVVLQLVSERQLEEQRHTVQNHSFRLILHVLYLLGSL